MINNSKEKDSNIFAILGPTNTGKTYLAFERLIAYKSGIFGFPLRLLARENYDKAVKKIGVDKVALITGEEKIYSKDSKYFFCTIESMPMDIDVECVALDEIQLAADYERGHIFTDRILNSRGSMETIFLGSLTIKKTLEKLFPKIKIESRDRFSKLSFEKKQNITKLKPRSAVIAFNINKVYEIAEMLRQHKGGAAVVLGSLSPRTRNAQVEVYESKKVDFLVATDAIGMGLNLNINHVSFSSFQKFDGRYNRNLFPAEIGQIAGRAGRYENDGTFGYTKNAGDLDPIIIQSIEDHNFNDIEKIYWRNSNIDFSSINSVLASLKEFPVKNFFIHKKNAEDEMNFRNLSVDNDIKKFLTNQTAIELLWNVCRIPDFQKMMNDNHFELLKNIYLSLINNALKIPESWLFDRIDKLDNYSGGIDELTHKIANIRTWTYISNQSTWLENNEFWKEKTQSIEDNLSDHLHNSLINRFVDSSASYFSEEKKNEPKIEIDQNKILKLNKQNYGYINGFQLKLFDNKKSISIFSHNRVKKTIRKMIEEKIDSFLNAPKDSIKVQSLDNLNFKDSVKLLWGDEPVGFLKKGENIFSPLVELYDSEFIENDKKILIKKKLQDCVEENIKHILNPIKKNFEEIETSSNVRSIIFNLFNSLGTMQIEEYKSILKNLSTEEKSVLSKLGIRTGAKFFFIPNLLKKNAIELNAILWKVFNNSELENSYPLPKDGRVSFNVDLNLPDSYWSAIGYIFLKDFAVRVDVFERIFFIARKKIKKGPFLESSDLMNPLGCNSKQLSDLLFFCGFENILLDEEKRIYFYTQKKIKIKTRVNKKIKNKDANLNKKIIKINKTKKTDKAKKTKNKADPNSPFAVLEKLL